MKVSAFACYLFLLFLTGISGAKTVAYWQLDGAADGYDAISDDNNFYDLSKQGSPADGNPAAFPNFPIPNPSVSLWRIGVGDGDPNNSILSQSLDGNSGWYMDEISDEFQFHNDASFTAECWFQTFDKTGIIFGNRHGSSLPDGYTGWTLWVVNAGTKLELLANGNLLNDPNSEVVIKEPVSWSVWYHVAVVWDHNNGPTGTLSLYLDGVEIASVPGDPNWTGVSGGHWAVGQRNLLVDENDPNQGFTWGQTGFKGFIDEVRFVNEALDPIYFLNASVPYVSCGDDGYMQGDLNGDCFVNIFDLCDFSVEWLQCTEPGEPSCASVN